MAKLSYTIQKQSTSKTPSDLKLYEQFYRTFSNRKQIFENYINEISVQMREDGKVSSNEFWNTPLLDTYDSRLYYRIDEVLSKAKDILADSVHQTHPINASVDLSTTQ